MNIRDVHEQAKSYFADWIRVTDTETDVSLDSYDLKTGMTSNKFENHYWECVTVNKCWFSNEEGKKPQEFDYRKYSFEEISLTKRGLYHPNCHCVKTAIPSPSPDDIVLLLLEEKINGAYKHKNDWMEKLGYPKAYLNLFRKQMHNLKKAYASGKYYFTKHTTAGYQITVNWKLQSGPTIDKKIFNIKTACIVFPNGKLRIVTVLGGYWK